MKKYQLIFAITLFLLFCVSSCHRAVIFTEHERVIIEADSSKIMRIYTVSNPSDTTVLRARSGELSTEEISSAHYRLLSYKMIRTVSDSAVDGVGIAGPQVGINRRIIAVQRFDKPGAPFEVFPNIYIKEYSKDTTFAEEGCLSVPDQSARVVRSRWVVISYTDPGTMTRMEDTISGFTSIIFQHETDHLDGILYTDRI